jgi:hypothetical protein
MQSFFEWFPESGLDRSRPWLILGKGPSFSRRTELDLSGFHLLSLNHAVREHPVAVAHIIDADVVEACAEPLLANAKVLVMPWRPHVKSRPGPEDLESLAGRLPVLRRLGDEGRLLWYNLGTASTARGDSPVVPVRSFSAEAALNLLVLAGVRCVRSLGVDGGKRYSAAFEDLESTTLLANGRSSFDCQFREMARTILRSGVDFAPLDLESPIRVYVAATSSEMLPVRVLEYSIKKHTSMTARVEPLHLTGKSIPTPKEERNQARTPFSFQRFLIPEVAGRQGHAIYLDADMQVFRDLRELWAFPMGDASILAVQEPLESGRRPQFSVMLLDCAALSWSVEDIVARLDSGAFGYEQLMYEMAAGGKVDRRLPAEWNSLEHYEPGRTALLHYTDMETQPWVHADNPLGYLWCRDLLEAVENGFIPRAEVDAHIASGHLRPSLACQLDQRLEDGLLLPRRARDLDRSFSPPYTRLPTYHRPRWRKKALQLRALARQLYRGSLLEKAGRRWFARG